MSFYEKIVNSIHEYNQTKSKLNTIKVEMVKLAVEAGCDQEYAMKSNIVDWLDGFLVAHGYIPENRRKKNEETM